MNFQEQITEAANGLTEEGSSVEVVPTVRKPKQFRDCAVVNKALKDSGISVVWNTAKECAVVCKGKQSPVPVSTPDKQPVVEEEKGPALLNRFAGWKKDEKEEN